MNDFDMSRFTVAKSDQLNADDLLGGPLTITITKVTAQEDTKEQPVSLHYENDGGRPYKPCLTMRRLIMGAWGKLAKNYIGRSMTLYRDPTVAFGGMQVGGIRISHMSDIDEEKTLALQVTRGRKAPFKIKPLVNAPKSNAQQDFGAQLAELRDIAKPGNMDALGAKWQEIGADARKALAAELPALKAACEAPADDVPFTQPEAAATHNMAEQLGLDDTHPARAKADEMIAAIEGCISTMDVSSILARHAEDIAAMPGALGASVEIAADRRRREIKAERQTEGAK